MPLSVVGAVLAAAAAAFSFSAKWVSQEGTWDGRVHIQKGVAYDFFSSSLMARAQLRTSFLHSILYRVRVDFVKSRDEFQNLSPLSLSCGAKNERPELVFGGKDRRCSISGQV